MQRMILAILAASVVVALAASTAGATQKHWVGTGAGTARNWNNSANWSLTQGGSGGAGVPVASDSVFIDGGGNCRVNTNAVCAYYIQSISAGTKDFANNATLTVGSGGMTISGGTLSLNASSNSLTLNGDLNLGGGTLSVSGANCVVTVKGDWIGAGGSFAQTAGTVTFSGLSTQSVSGTGTFLNLTVNNPAGVTLLGNVSVTGTLTLTAGPVTTGPNTLSVPASGSVARTSGWVDGNFQKNVATGATSRTFEIGDALTYAPVTVSFASVTTAGNLTASTSAAEHGNIANAHIDASKDANRTWTLTNSGVAFTIWNGTFNFSAGDIDGGANTANFVVDDYVAPTWFATTTGTRTATSTQATGLTRFGDFVVGEPKTITITSSAGANGSISPLGATLVPYNGSQGYLVTPNAGYHILDVIVDGSSVGAVASYNFSSVTANHTIAASFAVNTWTITASAGANGTISPAGAVIVNEGNSQSFTISANAGYHVADLLVDGLSAGAVTSYNFTSVAANHTISASFAINTYTLTASADANGSISPSGAVGVNYGGGQSFTITPNAAYHVADVLVDGSSVGAVTTYDFTNVTGDHTIAASFAKNVFAIDASAGANGSVSPSGSVQVAEGTDQSFTFTPSTGYHVAGVTVDGSPVGAVLSYNFTSVTANHTVAASFAIDTFTVTASAGANGSVAPAGVTQVLYGGAQSYTITPDAGYHVVDVVVDGSTVGEVASYDFTNVAANHTISATFAATVFTIDASAGANGSISPSGAVGVAQGSDQSFTVTPNAGYYITDVHVDSVSVGAVASYNFTNVQANHSIQAFFAIQSFTVHASAGAHGAISPSGDVAATYGSNASFTITPNTGYFVSDVHVDSLSVGGTGSYTFLNVQANHTIEAFFTVITDTIVATAGPHGTISPSGNVLVAYGSDQAFTVTADSGYFIADVHTDTGSVGAAAAYTFTGVTGNHTIHATFGALNTPPSAVALALPGNADSVDAGAHPVAFSWHPSSDPSLGDTLAYALHVWGPGVDTTIANLSDTSKAVDLTAGAQLGAAYRWTVGVSDGHVAVSSADTFAFVVVLPTGVADAKSRIPKVYALYQNYPNPFNPVTRLQYDIPRTSTVTLIVYNVLGAEVARLVDHQTVEPGVWYANLDGTNLASGVYIYRIAAEGTAGQKFVSVKKMMLLK